MAFEELRIGSAGSTFTDQSVSALSTDQADGMSSIIGANTNRKALKISPPSDCTLKIGSSGFGIPIFSGVANEFSGGDCPTNALFVTGLSAGDAVIVWEA